MLFALTVNCTWSDFGGWSSCSKTCGEGDQTRTRIILNAASHGGNDCTGADEDRRACKIKKCPGKMKVYLEYMSNFNSYNHEKKNHILFLIF